MTLIPFEQEYELYHFGESMCAQMVRVAFAEKEIDYKSHHIVLCDISVDGDNMSPSYLAVNPKAVVPTLIHNGVPIYDSCEIIRYIDSQKPNQGQRLRPPDSEKIAEIETWTQETSMREDVGFASTFGTAIPAVTSPIIGYCLKRQPVLHVIRTYWNHPMKERRYAFYIMRFFKLPRRLIEKAVANLAKGLVQIEKNLSHGGDYMLGEFTQIDVMLMVHFHRLEDVHLIKVLEHPSLKKTAAYWNRLQARASYESAITKWHHENWREAVDVVFNGKPSPWLEELSTAL